MRDFFDPLFPDRIVIEIYEYHEKLSKLYKCIKIINHTIEQAQQQGGVLFPALDRDDHISTYDLLSSDNKNRMVLINDGLCCYRGIRRFVTEFVEGLRKGNRVRYLISLNGSLRGGEYRRGKLLQVFRCIVFRCKAIDIYDELRKAGFDTAGLWYKECAPTYYEIFEDRKKLKNSVDNREKLNLTKRLFAEYFFIRDFMDIDDLFPKLSELANALDDNISSFEEIYKEIQRYLKKAQKETDGKPHIVMNWVDAVRFYELSNMPWLEKKMHEGLFFERMYTNTPYTSATMKSIFTGENLIEGKLYKSRGLLYSRKEYERFPFFRVLNEYGYAFKYIGTVLETEGMDPGRIKVYKHLYNDTRWLPSTITQFEGIRFLSETETPTFVIIHDLIETHEPFANPWYKCVAIGNSVRRTSYDLLENQVVESQSYQDELIKYYSKYYQGVRYNIFMSDHGKVMGSVENLLERMYHVILSINGKNIKQNAVNSLYSMQDFYRIIEQILSGEMDFDNENDDKMVVIENDDVYNSEVLERVTKAGDSVYRYVQLRGLITVKDAFFRFATGDEGYYLYGDEKNYIGDERFKKRIDELREKNGYTFIDIMKDSKYKAAARMYKEMGLIRSDKNEYIS